MAVAGYKDDTTSWPIKMIADMNSLDIMKFVASKMGVTINVLAKVGQKYSNRGGESSLVVPKNNSHIVIDAGNKKRTNDFWAQVSTEKTKRRLIWEAANPLPARNSGR